MEVWLMDEVKRAIARYDAARRRYRAAVSAAWLSPFRSTVIRRLHEDDLEECARCRTECRAQTAPVRPRPEESYDRERVHENFFSSDHAPHRLLLSPREVATAECAPNQETRVLSQHVTGLLWPPMSGCCCWRTRRTPEHRCPVVIGSHHPLIGR